MPNQHHQHFVVALHYEGPDGECFDAEGLADDLYHSYVDADTIDFLKCVVAHEEPESRPSYGDLEELRREYTAPLHPVLHGPDLAILSVICEVLDYALGKRPVEELHEVVARAQRLAVPVTRETLGRTPQTIRTTQQGDSQ